MAIRVERANPVYYYTERVYDFEGRYVDGEEHLVNGIYSVTHQESVNTRFNHGLIMCKSIVDAVKYLRDCNVNMSLKDAKDVAEALYAANDSLFPAYRDYKNGTDAYKP